MKKLILLVIVIINICQVFPNSDWHVTRTNIWSPTNKNTKELMPGTSINAYVKLSEKNIPTRKTLQIIGELKFPYPFSNRSEHWFRLSEFRIDDSLDSIITHKDKYSLHFKGDNKNNEQYCYYRLSGDSLTSGTFNVYLPLIKENGFHIKKNGSFGIEIEVFYKKYGRNKNEIYDKPDTLLYLPINSGNNNINIINKKFKIIDDIACLLIKIGGECFEGDLWIEAPTIKQNNRSIHIPFCKFDDKTDNDNYWVGMNLATRSWPLWSLNINGKRYFHDRKFDRASNITDFYIDLPNDIKEGDNIELFLNEEFHRASYNYNLRSINIIEESARDYEIISIPKYPKKNDELNILIETNKDNLTLNINAFGNINPQNQTCYFKNKGLHVIKFRTGNCGNDIKFKFSSNNLSYETETLQIIDKETDNIYISSGDEIYISKNINEYNHFFKWYFSNRIGNWYQFRPSYQWAGVREADHTFICNYLNLLEQLNIPFAWQVEGRTLAGYKINPPLNVLQNKVFQGKQAHENDGAYYYWRQFKYEGLFSDMAARTRPYGGIFAKHKPIYTDKGTFIHYDPYKINNMEEGAQYFVANLKYSKGESTRHTGPSTLFRYFYQAGYDWLGAEQMYGPEEVILSSLRGASRAYRKWNYGTLHAMQWGSHPFTDSKHSLRFYNSLAVAYINGVSHINTEEGLWTDEFMNDHYSKSGKEHLAAQQKIYDYIETHTRRGTQNIGIAVIQGRNDAWKCFGKWNLWSQNEDKWKFDKSCESFDLLNIFYPENVISNGGPKGWFSSTPFGHIDLLPIEAPQDILNNYKYLIFLGWNSFKDSDFEKIRNFVFDGGNLLLSAAHFNTNLEPNSPIEIPKDNNILKEMLGKEYYNMTGRNIIYYGKGKIIYYANKKYPSEKEIKESYINDIKEFAQNYVSTEKNNGWIKPLEKVEFSIWDNKDRRTIYLINNDWESDNTSQDAIFSYKNKDFLIKVRKYEIETIHCKNGIAIHPKENTTDIIDIVENNDDLILKIQTTGPDIIKCYDTYSGKYKDYKISQAGIHTIKINRQTQNSD